MFNSNPSSGRKQQVLPLASYREPLSRVAEVADLAAFDEALANDRRVAAVAILRRYEQALSPLLSTDFNP